MLLVGTKGETIIFAHAFQPSKYSLEITQDWTGKRDDADSGGRYCHTLLCQVIGRYVSDD